MKIITNYHKYPLMYYWELPEKWQKVANKEFDWDNSLKENSKMFIYKNRLYHLSNFLYYGKYSMVGQIPEEFSAWDSYENDSFFSGILIRFYRNEYGYLTDHEIQIATFYS